MSGELLVCKIKQRNQSAASDASAKTCRDKLTSIQPLIRSTASSPSRQPPSGPVAVKYSETKYLKESLSWSGRGSSSTKELREARGDAFEAREVAILVVFLAGVDVSWLRWL